MSGSAGPDPAAFAVALTDEIRGALSFQSYESPRGIEGVWIQQLRKHQGENGWLFELYRLEGGALEGLPSATGFPVRQVSVSFSGPKRINAFHIHPLAPQHEVWVVLQGNLLVWLVDCRQESATRTMRQKVVLSGESPAMLHIPAGVAHGYKAGSSGALLVYAMNQQFDIEAPNEGRLPWDYFGADLWEEDRG
jgi:dTDP-4-dehydrorhamnose 3,5-epimerase